MPCSRDVVQGRVGREQREKEQHAGRRFVKRFLISVSSHHEKSCCSQADLLFIMSSETAEGVTLYRQHTQYIYTKKEL